ncbi:hypothetical protein, partial [Candidatus Binatus sp.]|uniref:hypothetical protein n=1 Tax=Candidatus Binatus sp. TaxID=2811406 RepID=UPI003C961E5F
LEKNVDRSGYRIDSTGAKTFRRQGTQYATHWSVREWAGYRKAGTSFLKRDQRNQNEHDQRHSVIGFQSRFKGGELGGQVDGLRGEIESGDRDLERAHARFESGRAAAAGRFEASPRSIQSE